MNNNLFCNSICLVSAFHDTEGIHSPVLLKKHIENIKNTFHCISLVLTDLTSTKVFVLLDKNKISYKIVPVGFGSLSRKVALKNGLKTNCEYFFYIDLDRLLFWLEKYPQELIKVLGKITSLKKNDYLIIGRTSKAWNSHPFNQQLPEEKTNKAISQEIGKTVDVTPGCRAFRRKIANLIIDKVQGNKSGVSDIEWLMIAYSYGKAHVKSIVVDGLSYETKTVFGKERSDKQCGEYEFSRNQMADETIKTIDLVKKQAYLK